MAPFPIHRPWRLLYQKNDIVAYFSLVHLPTHQVWVQNWDEDYRLESASWTFSSPVPYRLLFPVWECSDALYCLVPVFGERLTSQMTPAEGHLVLVGSLYGFHDFDYKLPCHPVSQINKQGHRRIFPIFWVYLIIFYGFIINGEPDFCGYYTRRRERPNKI